MQKSFFLLMLQFSILFISCSYTPENSPFILQTPHMTPDTYHASYSYRVLSSNITEKSLQMVLEIIKDPTNHEILYISANETSAENIDDPLKTYINPSNDPNYYPIYENTRNRISKLLLFELEAKSPNYLSIKLKDKEKDRYEIPEADPYPHDSDSLTPASFNISDLLYSFTIKTDPFSIEVLRKSTNETLFTTEDFNLIFSEKYLEISSLLPSHDIFGLGERNHKFKLRVPGIYTLWNRDLFAELDDARGGKSTYGSHPMYIMHENSDKFHIVSMRNSHAMDVDLDNVEKITSQGVVEQAKVTYKLTGGVIDLRIFIGETAEDTVQLYHKYVGGHILPPFWALGFHLSRYGYKSWSSVRTILDAFQEYKMPLDVIWFDIDYMKNYRAFTIDSNRFNPETINNDLENVYRKKLVVILDPGIAIESSDFAYEEGIRKDIFLKNPDGTNLVGCVWPGRTHYPDFMNPRTQEFWDDTVNKLYDQLKFSGLWIDMNEFANLIDGAVNSGNPDHECGLNIHENIYKIDEKCNYGDEDYRVFNPGHNRLETNGVCLNAKHIDGLTEREVHNFNGLFNAKTTYATLKNKLNFKQPFILTRSTAPGSGKYAIHWTGDNNSGWEWMKISIAGILNFNMFGIPFVGADICGFAGEAWEELCVRWMQLGTVYPFYRNHNFLGSPDQDPFSFGDTMIEGSITSIRLRYSFLKYYYSLFVETKGIGTILKPLFFDYPTEPECYDDDVLDQEFLLSYDFLVTPILQPHEHQIHPYFPGKSVSWYDLHSGEKYDGGSHHMISCGLTDPIPMFLKAGSVIYRQEINDTVRSSQDLDNRFYLSVGLLKEKEGNGSYLESNGQMMACNDYNDFEKLGNCIDSNCMLTVRVSYKEFSDVKERKQLLIVFEAPDNEKEMRLDKVGIIGVDVYGIINDETKEIKKEAVGLRICGHKGQDLAMEEIAVKVEKEQEIMKLRFMRSMNIEASDQLLIELIT